ncbi:hypothetical protein BOTCAL_0040g00140 [Botryotinia calthae]|uniref:Uncharacterized protein n=1 Tax=Botryotinia calthae TaxID=38488 RepID=A0A4Y8DCA6_9HELO|nr:hypothetical protein BOTCAL_0040g00140 [Botryotinia calthae]
MPLFRLESLNNPHIIATVGSGLIFILTTTSTETEYVLCQILVGLEVGICRRIPFSAVPTKPHKDDLATAGAFVAFCNSGDTMLRNAIGQSILSNAFVQQARGRFKMSKA